MLLRNYQNCPGNSHFNTLQPTKTAVLLAELQVCEERGQCEEKCPYNLPVIKNKK
jgi:hypothetical protein